MFLIVVQYKHFLIARDIRQSDSSFLFILALEILFHLAKLKLEIKRLAIFNHYYLYYAYADDTFFSPHIISIKHMVDTLYFFRTLLD